jgi:hypothetical protein
MEIKIHSNRVTIEGNMKSIDDFQKIKAAVDVLTATRKDIYIEIVDSLSITSSIIGYLNKLVLQDSIKIQLLAKSEQLLLLLDDLGLSQTFRAKRLS